MQVLAPNQAAARTMLGTPYYMSPEICKARTCLSASVLRPLQFSRKLQAVKLVPA